MFKLVVVGGVARGKEFELALGDNIIGRDPSATIVLEVNGVSKRHMKITISPETAFLEDLGSSNGTFLNGKMVLRSTLSDGDKITLPNVILQLVYVKEKKVIVRKKIEVEEILPEYMKPSPPPPNPFGKILWFFRFKIMPVFHGINEEYEWRSLVGIVLTLFVVVTITLTIVPVLQDSKTILLYEIAVRGTHYAKEIERLNGQALEARAFDQLDTDFLKSEEGVEDYELFDLDGRIVRPLSRLNEYISDTFSIKAKEHAIDESRDDNNYEYKKGEIYISRRIQAYNSRTATRETVGVIAIRFSPKSLTIEATRNSKAYLESLTTSAIVAILFFGIVYYLTVRPLDEMRFEIEDALRGNRRAVEGKYLMSELSPLRDSVNTLLQKIRESAAKENGEDIDEVEEDGKYIETLVQFMRGAGVPAMILDSNKCVQRINSIAEDIIGMREASSQGIDILDVAREKGFAATIIDLCDRTAGGNGVSVDATYELSGKEYGIYAIALLGKNNFARAYYLTFIKEE
jgi:nucleoside diphosphate kinase